MCTERLWSFLTAAFLNQGRTQTAGIKRHNVISYGMKKSQKNLLMLFTLSYFSKTIKAILFIMQSKQTKPPPPPQTTKKPPKPQKNPSKPKNPKMTFHRELN